MGFDRIRDINHMCTTRPRVRRFKTAYPLSANGDVPLPQRSGDLRARQSGTSNPTAADGFRRDGSCTRRSARIGGKTAHYEHPRQDEGSHGRQHSCGQPFTIRPLAKPARLARDFGTVHIRRDPAGKTSSSTMADGTVGGDQRAWRGPTRMPEYRGMTTIHDIKAAVLVQPARHVPTRGCFLPPVGNVPVRRISVVLLADYAQADSRNGFVAGNTVTTCDGISFRRACVWLMMAASDLARAPTLRPRGLQDRVRAGPRKGIRRIRRSLHDLRHVR